MADMKTDCRDDTDGVSHIFSQDLFIYSNSFNKVFTQYIDGAVHNAGRLKRVEDKNRLHDIQLKLYVITDYLKNPLC
ncbi:hypothetical protein SC499_06325 [Peribacillus simplex]|uniref:hypothetical protein n=1 Tax=Peribacillus simplex TaxID=1478 RepID=UPI00298DC183|nr:hypothetical protein [Peribacillus simplex]MDW7614350.1 hypothetical protein [Peribacillus simplex]